MTIEIYSTQLVHYKIYIRSYGKVAIKVSELSQFPSINDFTKRFLRFSDLFTYF